MVGSGPDFITGSSEPVFLTYIVGCVTIYTMPFCFAPWTNIDISPMGDIAPCCKFITQSYNQKFNIDLHTVDYYTNSAFLQSIKQEFVQGTWPVGCSRCRIEEENQIKSKRQLDFERWNEHYANYNLGQGQFITASVAFGNTCNLTCITCSPYSSSRWRHEYQTIYLKDVKNFHFYKHNFVQDFVQSAPRLIHIDIPGGEPFLSGVAEQKALLQHYIDTDQAHRITLHYTTNVTVWPDSEWWKLWSHFQEIDMQLSIDGVGNRYNYIRYPADWNQIQPNIQRYLECQKLQNFRLSVSHTVSAYNIYYLDEFFSWCYNQGLPTPWLGRVHNPVHMTPTVWCGSARQAIADRLRTSQYAEVQTWAAMIENTDHSEHLADFKRYLLEHDQYREQNFLQVFPEMAKYI